MTKKKKDWNCPRCEHLNEAKRMICIECMKVKDYDPKKDDWRGKNK